jgi:hypothetical protein
VKNVETTKTTITTTTNWIWDSLLRSTLFLSFSLLWSDNEQSSDILSVVQELGRH